MGSILAAIRDVLRSALIIAAKEFKQINRRPAFWKSILSMQLLQLVMLGYLDKTSRYLPTVVVDHDHSAYSREFVEKMRVTTVFDIRYVTQSSAEARELIRGGRAKVGVVIPPDFHERRAAGRTASVLTLVDGSDSASSGAAMSAVSALATQMSVATMRARGDDRTLDIDPRSLILFNPEGSLSNFLLPGLMVVMLSALGTLGMMLIHQERDGGTLERLVMTSLNHTGLMIGKATPIFVITLVDGAVLMTLVRFVFGVPIRGSLLLLLASIALLGLTTASISIYIAASATTPVEGAQRAGYLTMAGTMLSGYFFPVSSLPDWLRPVSYALPATHAIEVMRALMLRGAGLTDVLPHVFYLTLIPVFTIWLALRAFRDSIGKL